MEAKVVIYEFMLSLTRLKLD